MYDIFSNVVKAGESTLKMTDSGVNSVWRDFGQLIADIKASGGKSKFNSRGIDLYVSNQLPKFFWHSITHNVKDV